MWSESVIERTVCGMGYELVDVEWAGGGVLRVYIDKAGERPVGDVASVRGITVDDCATVSEQLSRVLTVENVHYDRLEISSPGLDRPLKKPADFARFEGHEAHVRLRTAPDGEPRGKKQFRGVLSRARDEAGRDAVPHRFGLVMDGDAGVERMLEFSFDEVERARLVPQLKMKTGVRKVAGGKKR